jgi:hypothetical protein
MRSPGMVEARNVTDQQRRAELQETRHRTRLLVGEMAAIIEHSRRLIENSRLLIKTMGERRALKLN